MTKSRLTLAALSLTLSIAASAQVLYKVEGHGLASPSYLFGTHHLAPVAKIQEFGAEDPFKSADIVVGELDMTADQMQMAAAMQPHMVAPADSTLSKVISAEDYAAISPEFEKWSPMPGMTLHMLDGLKPMAVTTMVTSTMIIKDIPEFNPNEQLDSWFQIKGKAEGKKIVPLETADFQASVLFGSTPISYQAEALVELLKDPDKAIEQVKTLNKAYNEQDLKAMLKLSEDENEHPEFMMALLDRRNADWLTKLPAIMQEGSAFIAVGALHLAGEKGLVNQLRKAGYTVTSLSK